VCVKGFYFHNNYITQEWKDGGSGAHKNQHPPLKIKVDTTSGRTEYYDMQSADFGTDFRHFPGMTYNGQLVIANPIDGCKQLIGNYYPGKIVLMQTSFHCEYCKMAMWAEIAQAKGVLIVSADETLKYMPEQHCGQYVHLPTIMIKKSVGNLLRTASYTNSRITYPVCPAWNGLAPGFGMEQCDDNNTLSGDDCTDQCLWECGDGVLAQPEECDDQNRIHGDGCSAQCLIERFASPTQPRNAKAVAPGTERFSVSWEMPAEGKPTGG
jgi:cysteine-rich repeat protein